MLRGSHLGSRPDGLSAPDCLPSYPLIRIEAGTLEVAWASSDPLPRELSHALQGASGARPLRVFLASPREVDEAIDAHDPEPEPPPSSV